MSGGLALYWLSQNHQLNPAHLPIDGPATRVDTQVRAAHQPQ